eukprot:8737733-Pyramimonas_sp.AAC.1
MVKHRTGTLVAVSGPPPICLNYESVSSDRATLEFGGLPGKDLLRIHIEEISNESPCRFD